MKELGPGDPSDGGPNDGFIPASENPTSPERSLSPSNSDLAMLCTHNVSQVKCTLWFLKHLLTAGNYCFFAFFIVTTNISKLQILDYKFRRDRLNMI